MSNAQRRAGFHAIYGRIVVAERQFVSARLTPSAYAHGLGAILPKVVMARPAGARRTQTTIVRVPIHGRAEWEPTMRRRRTS